MKDTVFARSQTDGQHQGLKFRPWPRCMRGVIGLALWLAATGPLNPSFAAGNAPVKHVLVFGDSLSAGYGMAREDAWPSLLDHHLQDHATTRAWSVVNASISGETTHGGLTRLPATLAREHPAVVVLELGGNDALRGLPLDQAQQNLSHMVQQAKASGARVLLVGIALPPNFGEDYTRDFSAMFAAVARREHVPLLPNLVESLGSGRQDFQADGIHPQGRVQDHLLGSVLQRLEPMLK